MNDLLPLIEEARESGEFGPLSDYCKGKGWLRNPLFVLGEWYSIFLSNGVDIFCRLCAVDDRWLYVDGVSEHNESDHSGIGGYKPVGLSNVSIEAVSFMKIGNRDRAGRNSTRSARNHYDISDNSGAYLPFEDGSGTE